jgi:glutamate racemase
MGLLFGVAALVLACGTASAASTEGNACTCSGAVVSGTCYPTLADAIESATNGDTVLVGGKKIITEEIQFAKDLTIQVLKSNSRQAPWTATSSCAFRKPVVL